MCPLVPPLIDNFHPKSGPLEGGTIITITGQELGFTFDDFTNNSITIGTTPCIPTERDHYLIGQQILCTTGASLREVSAHVTVALGTRVGTSEERFRFVTPQILAIDPVIGPMAGGTRLTVHGSHLNIGNLEETRITVDNGSECDIM